MTISPDDAEKLVTPPTPSKLAQEVAAKLLEAARPKVTGNFQKDYDDWPQQGLSTEDMARIISEAIAPLERERDTWEWAVKAKDKQLLQYMDALEAAKASLSSLSLAVEQISQALEEPLTRINIGDWVDDVRDAAERARSLVVK